MYSANLLKNTVLTKRIAPILLTGNSESLLKLS